MPNPFNLPDWVPWWAQLLMLLGGILFLLALFLMPFSVFGLKSRLEAVEARLDELGGEIRALALRLPEPGRFDSEAAFGRARPEVEIDRSPAQAAARPPVPAASWTPDGGPRRPIGVGAPPAGRQEPSLARPRAEPRLDRFR